MRKYIEYEDAACKCESINAEVEREKSLSKDSNMCFLPAAIILQFISLVALNVGFPARIFYNVYFKIFAR